MTSPLEAAREIAPRAAALAAEAEAERRLPATLSDELAEAGLYRLCVPESLGGGEAPPRELLGAVEELARGDAAAGWCVAVCATAGMLAAYLEPDAAREVFGDSAGVVGGVFAPMGRAAATGGELTVDGRWRFCSNVDNCDWLMGGCVVLDGDEPRLLASGRPDIRLVLMRSAEVEVIDTWSVSGLRATGSHDIAVDGARGPRRALRVAAHRRSARARPAVRVPALRPAGGVDRRGRARDRARGARRSGGARRGQDADAEHAQARRTARDAVRRRPGRGLPARRPLPAVREPAGGLGGGGRRRGDPGRAARGAAAGLDPRDRGGGRGGRHRVLARGRLGDLRDEPAPAPLPRRARGDPAHARRPGDVGADRPLAPEPRVRRLAALTLPPRLAGALVVVDPGRDPVEAALEV